MRSLSSALLISLPLVLSFAACSKKDQSSSLPAGSNQTAPPTAATQPIAAPSDSRPQTTPPAAAQSPAPQPPVIQPIVNLPSLPRPSVLKLGPVTVQFQNSIAGYWRGTFATWKWDVVLHFNEDGLGSADIPAVHARGPASATIIDNQVTISAGEDTFKGTLEDGKMSGRWTMKGGSSDYIQLTKE
jgi:hypothetical protein